MLFEGKGCTRPTPKMGEGTSAHSLPQWGGHSEPEGALWSRGQGAMGPQCLIHGEVGGVEVRGSHFQHVGWGRGPSVLAVGGWGRKA